MYTDASPPGMKSISSWSFEELKIIKHKPVLKFAIDDRHAGLRAAAHLNQPPGQP
jgi:hypothetical protein